MSDDIAQRAIDAAQNHGPTRAREALMAEAIGDCGRLLKTAQSTLLEAQQIAKLIQEASAHMTLERERLERMLDLYGQAVLTLEKGARDRFTATITQQTRVALEQASAELRRASQLEQGEIGHSAVSAVQMARRAQAALRTPTPRSTLLRRTLDWVASPWGHRATLFMSVLAALVVYNSGIFSAG